MPNLRLRSSRSQAQFARHFDGKPMKAATCSTRLQVALRISEGGTRMERKVRPLPERRPQGALTTTLICRSEAAKWRGATEVRQY